jgi:hypothetical protein
LHYEPSTTPSGWDHSVLATATTRFLKIREPVPLIGLRINQSTHLRDFHLSRTLKPHQEYCIPIQQFLELKMKSYRMAPLAVQNQSLLMNCASSSAQILPTPEKVKPIAKKMLVDALLFWMMLIIAHREKWRCRARPRLQCQCANCAWSDQRQ